MDKLKPFQDKLKQRATFQLDVTDCVTEKEFQKAVNQDYLNKNHGGNLLAYLQGLKTKGLQKVQLNPRFRNGNSSKPGGTSVTVDLNGGSSTAESNGTPAEATPQMQMPAGLNAAASFGLGMPEIMDGYAAKRELLIHKQNAEDFKKLYEGEKEKRKKLGEKVSELLRENDQYSWKETTEKEPSKFDMILEGIFKNPQQTIPALMGAFNQFKGGGLNSPAEAQTIDSLEGYSEMQHALCETIGTLPDNFCEELSNIISRVAEPDTAFVNKLRELLQTPNLKTVHNG